MGYVYEHLASCLSIIIYIKTQLSNLLITTKMETKFLNTVAELSGKEVSELARMTQRQIADQVILPIILNPTGQDIRGWRIGDDYMQLMAEFGDYCYRQDSFTGEIMLEIALQRLSCGAVLHEASSYKNLPNDYWKYSAMCDQPGLMSDACWEFLQKQAETCLKANLTKDHLKKIVYGLIDHLDDQGNELGGYMLKYNYFKTDTKEVYAWAWQFANKNFPFEELYAHFATPERWQRFIPWLKENRPTIYKPDFCKRIGVTGFWEKRKVWKQLA